MSGGGAVEVVQQGLTYGSMLISGVFSVGFTAMIGMMWKTRVPMSKIKADSDAKFRADLMEQLEKQDADHLARVTNLEQRLEAQRSMYEARIDLDRVTHAGELSTMRHKMANLDQCLTMLLVLIEENPSKAQAAAKRVREMRAKQEATESAEKAVLHAARVTGAAANVGGTGGTGGTP